MLETSAKISGVIIPIIAMSLPLAQTLASLEVPQFFVHSIPTLTDNRYVIMFIMLLILMIAGCVMETTPNIVILAPILLPLALEIGMNEIHFCIFMVTSLGIGFITPPLGLNLFVVSGVTGTPVLAISRYAIPFVAAMLVVVVVLMLVPQLSLWLL
jgi:TRAP-type C4-dicarboxylate transport system permease large subunit